MAKPILIVGGGPAGLAAAHSLATFGQACILVEKQGELGGAPILEGYAKLVPSGEWARDAIGGMVDRAREHELVDIKTGTTVTSFSGDVGDFTAELSNGDSVNISAVILCTGLGIWHLSRRRDDFAGGADDFFRQRGALPVRWAQAQTRGYIVVRWFTGPPDRS